MFRILTSCTLFLVALTFVAPFSLQARAQDWPALRGANGYGTIATDGILAKTSAVELKTRWKRKFGSGYSSVVVVGDRAVTMYTDGTDDLVVCLNANTGETIWQTKTNPIFKGENGSFDGPISTPVIFENKVFAFSATGQLFCLSLDGGEKIWSRDVTQGADQDNPLDEPMKRPLYGFVSSPIVVADTLILQVGEPGKSIFGMDPATGKTKWTAGDDKIDSQSPSVMDVNGKTIVLAAGGKKLTGVDPVDGKVLFEYKHEGGNGQAMMPVPIGEGRVLLTNDDRHSRAIEIRGNTDKPGDVEDLVVEQQWQETSIKNTYNMPVLVEGDAPGVFAYSTRILTCVDPKTGKPFWKTRKPGDGFLINVDGHLVVITKKGSLHLAKASNQGYEEISKISDLFKELVWSVPAYSDDSVFVRSFGEIARVDFVRTDKTAEVASADTSEVGSGFQKLLGDVKAAESDAARKTIVDRWMADQTEFPVVEDNIVHFIYRGEQSDVALAGDFFGARQEKQMNRVDSTDLFYYAMKLPTDQRANYCFLIDFQPVTDSLNNRQMTSSMYAGEMEFAVRLSDKEPLKMSWFGMSKWAQPDYLTSTDDEKLSGQLTQHKIETESEKEIELDIYLPPGYDSAGEKRYPVAYVFDGAAAQRLGEMPKAVDQLFQTKPEQSAIVVFFNGGGSVFRELLAKQIVPYVDGKYNTVASRESRVVYGCGFIGSEALVVTAEQNELFANVVVQSPLAFAAQAKMISMSMRKVTQGTNVQLQWGRFDMFNPHENWDIRDGSKKIFDGLSANKNLRVSGGMVNDSTDWSSWKNRYHDIFEMFKK